jgi:hypothetical protein
MRLMEERRQAKQAQLAESMRLSAIGQAQILEHQAQLAYEKGDESAYVDCLNSVAMLHNVGAHEEAEALLGRIKDTLAKADADEAEAFVAASIPSEKRELGRAAKDRREVRNG